MIRPKAKKALRSMSKPIGKPMILQRGGGGGQGEHIWDIGGQKIWDISDMRPWAWHD